MQKSSSIAIDYEEWFFGKVKEGTFVLPLECELFKKNISEFLMYLILEAGNRDGIDL